MFGEKGTFGYDHVIVSTVVHLLRGHRRVDGTSGGQPLHPLA